MMMMMMMLVLLIQQLNQPVVGTVLQTGEWFYNDHCLQSGMAVKCGEIGTIECASEDGETCQWGVYHGVKDQPLEDVDSIAVSHTCPAWLNSDGSDSCDTLRCNVPVTQQVPPTRPASTVDDCYCFGDPHCYRFVNKGRYDNSAPGEYKMIDSPEEEIAVRVMFCGRGYQTGVRAELGRHFVESYNCQIIADGQLIGTGTTTIGDLVIEVRSTRISHLPGQSYSATEYKFSGGFGTAAGTHFTVYVNRQDRGSYGCSLSIRTYMEATNAGRSSGICNPSDAGDKTGCAWDRARFSPEARTFLHNQCMGGSPDCADQHASTQSTKTAAQECVDHSRSMAEAAEACNGLPITVYDSCIYDYCVAGESAVAPLHESISQDPLWYFNDHCNQRGIAVKCSETNHMIACASNNGRECMSGLTGTQKHEQLSGIVANEIIEIQCPGYLNADGSDSCEALGCHRPTCAEFTLCPEGKSIKLDAEAIEGASLTEADCCDPNCLLFTCPPGSQKKENPTEIMGSTPAACCRSLPTCASADLCTTGKTIKPNAEAISGESLTEATCCDQNCLTFTCPPGYQKKRDPMDIVGYNTTRCCSLPTCASVDLCTTGKTIKPNAEAITGESLSEADCCDQNCLEFTCPPEYQKKRDPMDIVGYNITRCCQQATMSRSTTQQSQATTSRSTTQQSQATTSISVTQAFQTPPPTEEVIATSTFQPDDTIASTSERASISTTQQLQKFRTPVMPPASEETVATSTIQPGETTAPQPCKSRGKNVCVTANKLGSDSDTDLSMIACDCTDIRQKFLRNGTALLYKPTKSCIQVEERLSSQRPGCHALILAACSSDNVYQSFTLPRGNEQNFYNKATGAFFDTREGRVYACRDVSGTRLEKIAPCDVRS